MIDTSKIKPGDRVRLTAENGDVAEFTVAKTDSDGGLESKRNYFSGDEWDTLEILKPTLTKQYEALKPGATFKFGGMTPRYMKVNNSHLVMLYGDGDIGPRAWAEYATGTTALDIEVVSEP